MSVFVDFQGFEQPTGHFVIKELSILSLCSKEVKNIKIFSPPCAKNQISDQYRETIDKIIANHHGIPWESGDVDYREVAAILSTALGGKFDYIYVKGENKKDWLTEILKQQSATIIDLDDFGCPSHEILQEQPTIRHMRCHLKCIDYACAYENTQRYKCWFIKNFTVRANLRKSILHFCAVENLNDLSKNDIAALPLIAILKFAPHEVDNVWDKLSEEQQQNPAIQGCKRCQQHPIEFGGGDVTGCYLYSLIKDCDGCKRNGVIIEK